MPQLRIIPAYAGSTSEAPSASPAPGDHPRIRGEHPDEPRDDADKLGSSPHTRGAPRCPARACRPSRIIPAYAGSTSEAPSTSQAHGDHPRIRGEHVSFLGSGVVAGGSSPHTRGALPPSALRSSTRGIIPAYAGSTSHWGALWHLFADHPRIRGEHKQVHISVNTFEGSSPHTRGAPEDTVAGDHAIGIIPAYAGSTSRSGAGARRRADHPRIRGEHRIAGCR